MIKEIKWKDHPNFIGGKQGRIFFENGYGASIVNGVGSYTNVGEFELAVLKGTKEDCHICYDTYLTDDVMGHLSPDDVDEVLGKIKKLRGEDDEQF